MTDPQAPPFLVLTAIVDGSARAAAVTCAHGDAYDRAEVAATGRSIAGLDVIELPIAPPSFHALRKYLGHPEGTVAIYDVFPLAAHLDEPSRKVAGQFLAADVLWTLDAQGLLPGIPLNVRIDVPKDWDKDPKAVHERLMSIGALDLSAEGIETFKIVKNAWEASAPKADAAPAS